MKIVFDRKTLADTLSRVKPFVPIRSPKPILSSLHLRAADEATFSATNLELSLQTTLRASRCDEGGDCLLRADRFVAIVQSATDAEVTLSSNNSGVSVTCGRGRWQLDTEPPDEYPAIYRKVGGEHVRLGARDFLDAAKLVGTCSDPNSSRYALNGVLIESDGAGTLTLVATDGRRLTRVSLPCDGGKFSGLVPKTSLDRLATGLIDAGVIDLALDETWFRAETSGCVGLSRLVEGRFPAWRDVIKPYSFNDDARLSSAALAEAVQQAVAAAGCNDGPPKVDMTFSDGMLTLESRSIGIGNATVDMPLTASSGLSKTKFTCQSAFLRELLRQLGDRELRFNLKCSTAGDADSIAFECVSPDLFYVLMGMSTS